MTNSIVVIFDLILVNLFYYYVSGPGFGYVPASDSAWLLWNLSYTVAVLVFKPLAGNRLARIDQIATRVFITSLMMALIFGLYLVSSSLLFIRPLAGVFVCLFLFVVILCSRLTSRLFFKMARSHGRNTRTVVFVGAGHNLAYLHQCMMSNTASGYRFLGYFDDHVSDNLPSGCVLLGNVADALPWLEQHRPHMLFCNLPSTRSQEIVDIINFCDRNFIHFYSVPNVRNYVHRAMEVEMLSDMPVLKLRKEPLQQLHNRVVKRLFDIVVSLLFIVTCFWWIYLFVALITKISMPGPVMFRQKRNGLLGQEFECLKFRSMKLNNESDSRQATANDERITKWGRFLRRSSIDELPQFINVLRGDMSIIGPRPHMVSHTVEYSELIDKYMVRHWVKPGITGWAQVTGSRGETHELWQMEERIRKDLWYIENWSFWLDVRIMFFTVWNVLRGDKHAV